MESVLDQANQKLQPIPQVKEYIGHLPLLATVNELVVQFAWLHLPPSTLYKNNAEEIKSMVGAKWNETVVDDFHGGKVSDFFLINGVFSRCLPDE